MSSITCDRCAKDIPAFARFGSSQAVDDHFCDPCFCARCEAYGPFEPLGPNTRIHCVACCQLIGEVAQDVHYPECCHCHEPIMTGVVLVVKSKYSCADCTRADLYSQRIKAFATIRESAVAADLLSE